MAIPKHLDEAVTRLNEASARIDEARAKPLTLENLREWLVGLTNYARAASDVQAFNNESVHEKLHEIAGRVGLGQFPPVSLPGARPRRPKRQGRG
jgi:hypothetical protein